MSEETYRLVHIAPAGGAAIERLSFGLGVPKGWQQGDTGSADADFTKPEKMYPLAVFMAPDAPAVFAVSVRPAFHDGAVTQWAQFLVAQHGMAFEAMRPAEVQDGKCVLVGATQRQDDGEVTFRLLFLEDGGALLCLTAMAPTEAWPQYEETFQRILGTFKLDNPQGPTHPLAPGEEVPAARPAQSASAAEPTFRDFVQADNLDALEPSHQIVAYFMNNGLGLVPRVHEVNQAEGYATVAAAAIEAFFRVPLGWHVIDDTRRTLIFDKGSGGTQINVDRTGGGSVDEIFSAIEQDVLGENPGARHQRIEVDGIPTLAFRGLSVDGETLDQVYLLRPHPRGDGSILKIRVTTTPETTLPMLNLTGLIMQSVSAGA